MEAKARWNHEEFVRSQIEKRKEVRSKLLTASGAQRGELLREEEAINRALGDEAWGMIAEIEALEGWLRNVFEWLEKRPYRNPELANLLNGLAALLGLPLGARSTRAAGYSWVLDADAELVNTLGRMAHLWTASSGFAGSEQDRDVLDEWAKLGAFVQARFPFVVFKKETDPTPELFTPAPAGTEALVAARHLATLHKIVTVLEWKDGLPVESTLAQALELAREGLAGTPPGIVPPTKDAVEAGRLKNYLYEVERELVRWASRSPLGGSDLNRLLMTVREGLRGQNPNVQPAEGKLKEATGGYLFSEDAAGNKIVSEDWGASWRRLGMETEAQKADRKFLQAADRAVWLWEGWREMPEAQQSTYEFMNAEEFDQLQEILLDRLPFYDPVKLDEPALGDPVRVVMGRLYRVDHTGKLEKLADMEADTPEEMFEQFGDMIERDMESAPAAAAIRLIRAAQHIRSVALETTLPLEEVLARVKVEIARIEDSPEVPEPDLWGKPISGAVVDASESPGEEPPVLARGIEGVRAGWVNADGRFYADLNRMNEPLELHAPPELVKRIREAVQEAHRAAYAEGAQAASDDAADAQRYAEYKPGLKMTGEEFVAAFKGRGPEPEEDDPDSPFASYMPPHAHTFELDGEAAKALLEALKNAEPGRFPIMHLKGMIAPQPDIMGRMPPANDWGATFEPIFDNVTVREIPLEEIYDMGDELNAFYVEEIHKREERIETLEMVLDELTTAYSEIGFGEGEEYLRTLQRIGGLIAGEEAQIVRTGVKLAERRELLEKEQERLHQQAEAEVETLNTSGFTGAVVAGVNGAWTARRDNLEDRQPVRGVTQSSVPNPPRKSQPVEGARPNPNGDTYPAIPAGIDTGYHYVNEGEEAGRFEWVNGRTGDVAVIADLNGAVLTDFRNQTEYGKTPAPSTAELEANGTPRAGEIPDGATATLWQMEPGANWLQDFAPVPEEPDAFEGMAIAAPEEELETRYDMNDPVQRSMVEAFRRTERQLSRWQTVKEILENAYTEYVLAGDRKEAEATLKQIERYGANLGRDEAVLLAWIPMLELVKGSNSTAEETEAAGHFPPEPLIADEYANPAQIQIPEMLVGGRYYWSKVAENRYEWKNMRGDVVLVANRAGEVLSSPEDWDGEEPSTHPDVTPKPGSWNDHNGAGTPPKAARDGSHHR